MDSPLAVYLGLAISVVLSALFSGMEIAFLSANRLRLELDKKSHSISTRIIQIYTDYPNQFIASILVGNNLSVVVYGMAMSALLTPWLSALAANESLVLITETLISTIFILLVAEFLPKTIFRASPNTFLKVFAVPVFFFYIVFYPVSRGITWLSARLISLFTHQRVNPHAPPAAFGKTDLNYLVDEASNSLDEPSETNDYEHEIKVFQNALEFSDVKIRDCLVPRPDIEAIEVNATIGELRDLFLATSFSRIPVYEDNVDNIIGYVNAKSLFRHPKSIRDILFPIQYIPETAKANKMLTQLIRTSQSIAIVVDEFGGTAGLITIEDLVEEIFGEINDEHDTNNIVMKRISPTEYILSGRAEVDELNHRFSLDIPESEGYDTIAGYILDQHPSIPNANDELQLGSFLIHILQVDESRIVLVRLTVLDD